MSERNDPHSNEPTSIESAPSRDVKYFRTLGSGVLKGAEAPADLSEGVDGFIRGGRADLIDKFPSELEGLNIDKIDAFFVRSGLRRSPLIVWPFDRQGELTTYLAENVGPIDRLERGGVYLASLDLTIVFRDKALEEANGGPEITEGFIVHEQAHGTNTHTITRVVESENGESRDIAIPRHGQATSNHAEKSVGLFLEEAFADYVRGQYLEEIGMENGVLNISGRLTATLKGYGQELPILAKYVYNTSDRHQTSSPSSHAAVALEMLIEKDPDLWPAMVKARHDVDGLREVAQRLNAIQPGFYKALRDNFNGEPVFHQGLGYVMDVLESLDQHRAPEATTVTDQSTEKSGPSN